MADQICVIEWRVHPFRADRWLAAWLPAAERAAAFGARSWSLTRSEDDPLHFRQTTVWEDRAGFERYWASDEVAAAREQAMSLYNKPLVIGWYTRLAGEPAAEEASATEASVSAEA